MTEISFHFNVPDRTEYTCRFLRKVTRLGAKVIVVGPLPALAQFDRALWTWEPLEFVPHAMLPAGAPVPERLASTPVWLLEDASDAPHHEVLINLGAEPAAGFESFARLIEIVSSDEADRAAARQRWKHYASRGYAIDKHEVAA